MQSAAIIVIDGKRLDVDERQRIIISQIDDDKLLDQIIAVAHQGDVHHRSSEATATIFMNYFTVQGMTVRATRCHIVSRCRACLSCIKLRAGGSVPRPLWYLVRATKPFELIHANFMSMPTTVDGHDYLLVIVDDMSLTTVLVPTQRATVEAVVRALLEH